ncbi:MAG: hypothetical protein MUF51_03670 [Vicinamibacteria bacterium]|jgi:hypothetical protein|nr:hypothetical protein [Vicinamibacteria bacterium]
MNWMEVAHGTLALAALLALPGLLAVRAPWCVTPLLSASFWMVSWWWLPHPGRERFLWAIAIGSGILALARLLAPLELKRPQASTLGILLVVSALGIPALHMPTWPGDTFARQALEATLMVWRDGIPRTYEPLLPILRFGAYPPGLSSMAADLSLFGALAPHSASMVVAWLAQACLALTLYSLLTLLFSRPAAVSTTALFLALSRGGLSLIVQGEHGAMMAIAFTLCAWSVALRGPSPPKLTTISLLLAAAVLLQPAGACGVVTAGLLAIAILGPTPALAAWTRRQIATGLGLTLILLLPWLRIAIPHVWKNIFNVLRAEAQANAAPLSIFALGWLLLALLGCAAWLRDAERISAAAWAGAGLGLTCIAASHLCEQTLAIALCELLLCLPLALWLTRMHAAARRPLWVALALAALCALGFRHDWAALRAAQPLTADDLAAMAYIRAHTRAHDVICSAEDAAASHWVPAIAHRSVRFPPRLALYEPALTERSQDRDCHYDFDFAFTSSPPATTPDGREPVYRNATRALWRIEQHAPVRRKP